MAYKKKLPRGLTAQLIEPKQFVDVGTGEIYDVNMIPVVKGKRRKKAKLPYTMVFESNNKALRERRIDYDEFAVLSFCAGQLEWENQYVCDNESGQRLFITDIAKLMDKDKEFISRKLRSLDEKGFVTLEKQGKGYVVSIPENIAYKGELKNNARV